MEKTLISWNVPNLLTIWLMLFLGLLLFALAAQTLGKWSIKSNGANGNGAIVEASSTEGGY